MKMNKNPYMTLALFKTLKEPDWDNGAVRDELYESVKRMGKMEAGIQRIQDVLDNSYAWDVAARIKVELNKLEKEL
jgi:hypothetical protein